MNIIRDEEGHGLFMIPLWSQWGIRRCNQAGCREVPSTIIANSGAGRVFGLCETHFQQGNVPGGTKYRLVFDDFDAFKALEEARK